MKSSKIWENFDSVFCPGRLGTIRDKIIRSAIDHKLLNVEFLEYDFDERDVKRAMKATSYVMLQYSKGKTGLKKGFDKNAQDRITFLKNEGITLPILFGIGISNRDQIKHALDSGSDGVVIGSGAVSAALKGKNYLTDYLCEIRETLNEK